MSSAAIETVALKVIILFFLHNIQLTNLFHIDTTNHFLATEMLEMVSCVYEK